MRIMRRITFAALAMLLVIAVAQPVAAPVKAPARPRPAQPAGVTVIPGTDVNRVRL